MDGWMHAWMHGWMDGWMDGCIFFLLKLFGACGGRFGLRERPGHLRRSRPPCKGRPCYLFPPRPALVGCLYCGPWCSSAAVRTGAFWVLEVTWSSENLRRALLCLKAAGSHGRCLWQSVHGCLEADSFGSGCRKAAEVWAISVWCLGKVS